MNKVQEFGSTLFGETCKVMVYQVKKTVWTAHGTFKGRQIDGKGRTAHQAFTAWKDRVNSQEFN